MIKRDLKDLARQYGAKVPKVFEWRPHVFPKYLSPIVISPKGEKQIIPSGFGLIPFWTEGAKPTKVLHNAKSETLTEKVSFKKLFATKRCLIPLDSFFEPIWETDTKCWNARFFPKDGAPLTAAGLYSVWANEDGVEFPNYTMITKAPPKFIKETGHDRCPYFLTEKAFDDWLNPEIHEYDELYEILKGGVAKFEWDFERIDKK
jgi:putative SOS response-associated peptidase YedK